MLRRTPPLWKRTAALLLALLLAACQGVLVADSRSQYSHIRVVDEGGQRTMWFLWDDGNATLETVMKVDVPHELQHPYSHTMMAGLLYARRTQSCLVVGLGGGALVRFLDHDYPDMNMDVVEIDPEVVHIARTYFGTVPGPRTSIIVGDAEQYLRDVAQRYDIIFFDAHLKPGSETDAIGVPSRLRTVRFLQGVRQRLQPGGVVVFNLIEGPDVGEGIEALRLAFDAIEVFLSKGPGNTIVVASASGALPGEAELQARAQALDRVAKRNFSYAGLLEERVRRAPR